MKAVLRARPHTFVPGALVYEVWWGPVLIAEVTGADEPGVRIISKHSMSTEAHHGFPNVVTVKVEA